MSDLKPCPCGETPTQLNVLDGSTFRWRYVDGDCCGMWMIEARVTTTRKMSDKNIYDECVMAWNDAPRSDDE